MDEAGSAMQPINDGRCLWHGGRALISPAKLLVDSSQSVGRSDRAGAGLNLVAATRRAVFGAACVMCVRASAARYGPSGPASLAISAGGQHGCSIPLLLLLLLLLLVALRRSMTSRISLVVVHTSVARSVGPVTVAVVTNDRAGSRPSERAVCS